MQVKRCSDDLIKNVICFAYVCYIVCYIVFVFIWSTIYFLCNTFPAYNKCKPIANQNETRKEPVIRVDTICHGTSCWHKCGYFMDAFNSMTDMLLFLSSVI